MVLRTTLPHSSRHRPAFRSSRAGARRPTGHRRKLAACLTTTVLLVAPACDNKSTTATAPTAKAAQESFTPTPGNHRPAEPGVNVPAIKVDTVGYPSKWAKMAVFNVEPKDAVVKTESGEVAYSFKPEDIEDRGRDKASRDLVWAADFSALQTPGRYVIESGDAKSDPFTIGDDIYDLALQAGLKAFYFQRTRTALEAPYAVWEGDEFLRKGVSHAHKDVGWDIKDYPKKKLKWKVEAGWHDAGNYDMYVPSTAPTTQALLMAYEANPDLFPDGHTNIPESGNGIPDILDEALWGVKWVLSVQEKDGGFRLRETVMTQDEVGSVPADQDMTVRWIDRVGSASTAKGCAMAALASRVYAKHNPKLAKRAAKAAQKAWEWLQAHPERVLVPPTGAAKENGWLLWDDGENVDTDKGARFLAAATMWDVFRDDRALVKVKELLEDDATSPYSMPWGSWVNLSRWGAMSLAMDEKTPEEVRNEAKERLLTAAKMLKPFVERDGYSCASRAPQDYYWGHNSNLLEKAHLLQVAYQLDPSLEWAQQAVRDQWHWILGRNPNGFSMITRVGNGPKAFYHAEWGPLYPKVPPGNLVGGPNYDDMKFLSPDAPAKAILWESPQDLKSGVPKGGLWHWKQDDLWEAGFLPEGSWDDGWWGVVEGDIYYQGNLAIMAAYMVEAAKGE